MNLKSKFKRLLSAILSFAVIGTALPSTLAVAEEVEKYPYSVLGISQLLSCVSDPLLNVLQAPVSSALSEIVHNHRQQKAVV